LPRRNPEAPGKLSSPQVRMCQSCFHARKAANPRIVPVTPKAEKRGMNARGKRKKDAKDVNDEDMSKLRLYCPFMFKALEKAGALKKKEKRKPKKGDDDFDSDDEEAELIKKKKKKAVAKAKADKKKGKGGMSAFGRVRVSVLRPGYRRAQGFFTWVFFEGFKRDCRICGARDSLMIPNPPMVGRHSSTKP